MLKGFAVLLAGSAPQLVSLDNAIQHHLRSAQSGEVCRASHADDLQDYGFAPDPTETDSNTSTSCKRAQLTRKECQMGQQHTSEGTTLLRGEAHLILG